MNEIIPIIIILTLALFFLLVLYIASKINALTQKMVKVQELLDTFQNIDFKAPEENDDKSGEESKP